MRGYQPYHQILSTDQGISTLRFLSAYSLPRTLKPFYCHYSCTQREAPTFLLYSAAAWRGPPPKMDSKSTFISMKEKTDFIDSIISSHSNDDEGEYDRAYRTRLREVPGSWVLSNVRELYQQVGNIFASRRFTSKGFI